MVLSSSLQLQEVCVAQNLVLPEQPRFLLSAVADRKRDAKRLCVIPRDAFVADPSSAA